MDKYTETFETWNRNAGLYADKFMELHLYDDTYDAFMASLPIKDARILELGCGPGNITRYLCAQNPELKIEAIDIAANMIALAQTFNQAAHFQVMDVRDIRRHWSKSTFNGIVMGFCLPYLDEPDMLQLLRDAYDLLTPEGVLYFSFVPGDYDDSGLLTGSSGDRVHFYYYQTADLVTVLKQLSFELINMGSKAYINNDESIATHTIIIARKA
ncbi:class I SAM-dependent methyltransferase [Taibaiella sp. KBW10]|uniref:class I SAM-dependent methyltransferase n=1 Tax=Taibaiella sp. KBW10 TaxID=2153357 RepID=UPI000F5A2AE2|nr:class I SAM-dependent methyltransferase [Taibaiella sp. KBW10]RQO32208.1 class I SAM-dependent methyltransferase [Taibaiella sp. KBW10]